MKNYIIFLMLVIQFITCGKDSPNTLKTKQEVTGPSPLHTDGRWIKNENNDKVILRGVNIASLEWTSAGDNVPQSLEHVIDVWGANLARIPLSQDRWFGKAPEQTDDGSSYRKIVDRLVEISMEKASYLLLELHWNNADEWGQHIGHHRMPDNNSMTFLKDLAKAYANKPSVLIGTYNEPHDISWDVWLNGGEIRDNWDRDGTPVQLTYTTPGQQKLYDAIREAGATDNLVVIGGLDWGYDLSGILNGYAVTGANIVYDTHPYPWKDEDWNGKWGDVGRLYPILVGEWGGDETPEHKLYGGKITNYLRHNQFCWTAWDFHVAAGPTLIKDWDYNPTWFGTLVMKELGIPVETDNSF